MAEAVGQLPDYAVFICYSHADNKEQGRQWATWLHHSLETYEVPPDLIGKRNSRGETVPVSLFPVFLDEEELPANADLSTSIQQALERSRLMVVICSPRAVGSRYVDQEIHYFKHIGKSDRILPLIVDGAPDTPSDNCFPQSLIATEPLAADVRPAGKPMQGWTSAAVYRRELEDSGVPRQEATAVADEYQERLEHAKLKVIAGALGLPLGELTRRDRAHELAKSRARARRLRAWLAVVSVLAMVVAASAFLAFRGQREAIRQRDRALGEAYVLAVRQAAAKIAEGDFGAAREVLLKAPRSKRAWEWWYLIARCGPSPRSLSDVEKVNAPEAASMKSDLDAIAATSTDGRSYTSTLTHNAGLRNDIVFEYGAYGGRGGTEWRARRVGESGAVLLNGFATGMYGSIPAAKLGPDARVFWRVGQDDGTRRKLPQLASGEKLPKTETDYVTFLRERYVIGPLGSGLPPDNLSSHDAALPEDRRTWTDLEIAAENGSWITTDSGGQEMLILPIYGFDDGHSLNLKTGVISTVASPAKRWQNLVLLMPPDEQALAITAADRQGMSEDDLQHYEIAVERGSHAPVVLSTWNFGNVRIRDAATGYVIGESISPVREHGLPFYGGAAAIVPGTDLIAGWFWWQDKIIAGVADLRERRLVVKFEKAPDMNEEFATTLYSSMTISPNGQEAAFQFSDRNDRYFAVWNVKNGKMIYGPEGSLYQRTPEKSSDRIPSGFSWHPDGDYLVIAQANGVVEVRRSFASAAFAQIEGATGGVGVQPLDEKSRVLIGNAVVDTETWQTMMTLPSEHYVSRDGDLAVLQTRVGVVEVVRLEFRRRPPPNLRESLLWDEIRHSASSN